MDTLPADLLCAIPRYAEPTGRMRRQPRRAREIVKDNILHHFRGDEVWCDDHDVRRGMGGVRKGVGIVGHGDPDVYHMSIFHASLASIDSPASTLKCTTLASSMPHTISRPYLPPPNRYGQTCHRQSVIPSPLSRRFLPPPLPFASPFPPPPPASGRGAGSEGREQAALLINLEPFSALHARIAHFLPSPLLRPHQQADEVRAVKGVSKRLCPPRVSLDRVILTATGVLLACWQAVVRELWNVEEMDVLAMALQGNMSVKRFNLTCIQPDWVGTI
ncbi:unnamed protein product [Closterium sp. NIES-64]|nr:unnamed protein product [Closterium sp. NIES-64]